MHKNVFRIFQDVIKKSRVLFKDLNRIQGLFKTTTKIQDLFKIVRTMGIFYTLHQSNPHASSSY